MALVALVLHVSLDYLAGNTVMTNSNSIIVFSKYKIRNDKKTNKTNYHQNIIDNNFSSIL